VYDPQGPEAVRDRQVGTRQVGLLTDDVAEGGQRGGGHPGVDPPVPVRVPDRIGLGDWNQLFAVVRRNCAFVGGAANLLVLAREDGEVNKEYAESLRAFDPDMIGTPYSTPRPSLGAGFLPSWNPPQVMFERRQKRRSSQWSAGMLVGTPQSYVLFSNHPGEDGTSLRSLQPITENTCFPLAGCGLNLFAALAKKPLNRPPAPITTSPMRTSRLEKRYGNVGMDLIGCR